MRKIKKSIWLPVVLLIYFICMTAMFAQELISSGQQTRLYTVVGVETVVILALFFSLRKKERMEDDR